MAHTPYVARLEELRVKVLGIDTVQEFVDRLNADARKVIPYATARRYHKDREPPVTYLVKVAQAFDVSLRWLLLGEGDVKETTRRVRRELDEVRDKEITAVMLDKLGRPPEAPIIIEGQPVQPGGPRPLPGAAIWSGSIRELCGRWWDLRATEAIDAGEPPPDFEEAAEALGDALAAPLRALGLQWDDMSEQKRNDYILGAVVVLSNAIGPRP